MHSLHKICTNKTLILVIGYLCTCIFIIITNHNGDLEYYLNENMGLSRTGLMAFAVYPFTLITKDLELICVLWGVLFIGVAIKLQNCLSILSCYLLLILGPFLLIPSKESLVFISFLICISLSSKGFKYYAVLVISILSLLRPVFIPIFLILMIIWTHKKPIKLLYIIVPAALIVFVFLLLNNTQSIEYVNGYLIGYYDNALNAGTTDWEFIEHVRNETSITSLLLTILSRCFIPVWMLFLGGAGTLYFIWYLIVEFTSITIIYSFIKNHNYGFLKIHTFAVFSVAIIPISILLVTNAGSAVRYISVIPLILECIRYNCLKK